MGFRLRGNDIDNANAVIPAKAGIHVGDGCGTSPWMSIASRFGTNSHFGTEAMKRSYEYVRDPEAIYRLSSELVAAATDVSGLPPELRTLACRLVHACGMPDIVGDLRWHGSPVDAAGRALQAGACVLVDSEMVADGIIRSRLPAANKVLCSLNDPRAREIQRRERTTRSAAAVELWREHLPGSVVAIGNAPTALFRLLETLNDAPNLRPAAILAFPVGFVGAAESKLALVEAGLDIPFVTLLGRRGGSAMAAAAVNALCGPLAR